MDKKRLTFLALFLMVFVSVFADGNKDKNILALRPNENFCVKENYDLDGATIDVPIGCVLKFDGGSISNGTLSSDEPFSIEAGYEQIFKNVKFTIKPYNTIKIQAEWFGVERRNTDIENSKNLQDLFNSSKSLHVSFQDGIYRFSIDHPVTSYGRTSITGECAGSFSDTPRTWFVITGNPSEPKFFLTCNTERTTLKHIMFMTLNGNDYKKYSNVGAVFLRDKVNPGNIDSSIDDCMFYNVGCSVKAYGRGLSITNTRFQEGGGIVLKQTKSSGSNLSQQPPYDGRGLFLDNIRLHWPARGIHPSGADSPFGAKDFTLITIQNNKEVNNSTFFGVIMNNIYADGACRLIDCDSDVNSFTLTNVFCARPLNDFIHFRKNVSNLIVSKMIAENYYHYISEKSGDNILTFNGNAEHSIISDNIFGAVKQCPIAFIGNASHSVKNLIVSNNIFKGAHCLIGFENVNANYLRIKDNIIEKANDFTREIKIIGLLSSTKVSNSVIEN